MERSVSCAERGSAGAPAPHLRSYSASYAPRASAKVRRAQSATSWSRPAPDAAVPRSGSARSAAAPRFNLRSYSASYAASYAPFEDAGAAAAAAGGGQLRRSGSVASWASSSRRSVNLRGYAPSFSALDLTATVAAAPAPKKAAPSGAGAALDDAADLRRKKRLVVYKAYDMEGKVRSSVRRGVSWIKGKFSRAVYGGWS